MIVAGLQMDIAWKDPDGNFEQAESMVVQATGAGARLVALPEMFATGFSMDAAAVCAEAERTMAFVAELARRHQVWIVYGLAEPTPQGARNVARVVDPLGSTVGRYEKIHPFTLAGEHKSYAGGASLTTADVGGLRVTPLVCYDLRFPEPFRIAADDTDLFVVIANWPRPRRVAWRTLLRARAMENQAFVLGVNRVGEGDGLVYTGDSALLDPMGEVISSAAGQNTLVLGDATSDEVKTSRDRYSFLQDRRPSVYDKLAASRRVDATGGSEPSVS